MGLSEIFIKVLNMSVTASYVIAVVMVVRLFISKLPKKYSYALWSIAGLRLIFPFSVSWVFSFFNLSFFDGINTAGGQEYVPLNIGFAHTPADYYDCHNTENTNPYFRFFKTQNIFNPFPDRGFPKSEGPKRRPPAVSREREQIRTIVFYNAVSHL